jgi:alpha-L-fucosidase 2
MSQTKNNRIFLTGSLILISGIFSMCVQEKSEYPDKDQNLVFSKPSTSWDEAIPLGNGMLGVLVWQNGGNLRFSLDRADLWDLRPIENLGGPEFSFRWVQEQVRRKNYKEVQDRFDAPYDQLPAPTKIPGAALEFDIQSLGEVSRVELILQNALCRIRWKNGAKLETFVNAANPEGWFRFENIPGNIMPMLIPPQYKKDEKDTADNPVTGQELRRLGYEQGQVVTEPAKIIYRQKGWNGFEYEAAVSWKSEGTTLTGVWTISSTFSEKEVNKKAGELVPADPERNLFDLAFRSHSSWWKDFWDRSSVAIPDTTLEKQWYLEQYKFGSAARPDTPPISLQAVWTADNGRLPPWKGDFHHDLNTQLSYWPAYSSNHLDLEEGFLNWLWKNKPEFEKYTRTYFDAPGLNVPGVTTLTGEPMGGWIQYSLGPTVACWLAHHFYLHWKYSGDENFLRERAYPWIRDVAVFLDAISVKGEDGLRNLPLSSSPEIHNNSIDAWFTRTTNYDLAFIRWTFEKAGELAGLLGKAEDAVKWETILKEWPDFALDSLGGFAFAPGNPYTESHRHFSHQVGFHPLGIIDWSKGDKDQKIIRSTLKTLEDIGPDWWCGYSYSWLGNMYARAFMGEKAEEALRIFSENFCLPNSFHVNGEQHDKGYSKFKYRPFTLEGNFAFASAVQEMLIQSHTGVIVIFPAVPAGWENASFRTLRAEGAFLVSAERKKGQTKKVEIISLKRGKCRLRNPFADSRFRAELSWKGKVEQGEDVIVINFPENGRAILKAD